MATLALVFLGGIVLAILVGQLSRAAGFRSGGVTTVASGLWMIACPVLKPRSLPFGLVVFLAGIVSLVLGIILVAFR